MHIPVLLNEVLEYWPNNPQGFYVDLTVGHGGHSLALLQTCPRVRLLGLDWDLDSLKIAEERLKKYDNRVMLKLGNFAQIERLLKSLNIQTVDGFLFDLGPSSYQILERSVGLTFTKDEPLDMRMAAPFRPFGASDFVRSSSMPELTEIFRSFGELSFGLSRRLAQTLVEFQKSRAIKSTGDLTHCLSKVTKNKKVWAQAFQALRIVVNGELDNLKEMLATLAQFATKGTRVVGISFHSLEDRIVKQSFGLWVSQGSWLLLAKKPRKPSDEEISQNPRARSAKLRAVEKR